MTGTPFGRYQLTELLGRGGMGEVWKAYDTATQRVVAVKVLPARLGADPNFERRFRREALAAAALNEPHVVPIHNFGEIDGRLYVDMRLIEGEDLEHVLTNGPLEPQRAVKIIGQVASALNAAHRIGLAHRDVKPSNILVAEDDFAYLIDFGIARGEDETGMTGTGDVVGTWPYMAPERFTAGQTDTRADIYALTCVLYECLTSSTPFPGDSVEQQIAGHLTAPPPRPSDTCPGISPELDAVIARGMAKDPKDRYTTATELADAARTALAESESTGSSPESEVTAAWIAPSAPTEPVPTVDQLDEAWAPTQARAAEAVEEPWPWWRRPAVLVPAAALTVAAVVAVSVAVAGKAPPPPSNGGLDGTYAVQFATQTRPDGQPDQNAPGDHETWVLRSACPGGHCVATATKVAGSQTATATMVLDDLGGRWTAVSATPGQCQNARTELWEAMSLQPRQDGSLQGEFVVRSAAGCDRTQQVMFTRTGDVQGAAIADPATEPARVVSPAQALHGRYRETDTYTEGARSAEVEFDVQSYCLRTGRRCMSYWRNATGSKVLLFTPDTWVLASTSSDSTCKNGGRAHRDIGLQYPLPQPPQDPINVLTGHGHYAVTGDCPFNSDFDSRVQRIGA